MRCVLVECLQPLGCPLMQLDTPIHKRTHAHTHKLLQPLAPSCSIIGLTIDYGPFGFMDAYNPDHVCNGSDDSGRYSYKCVCPC